MSPALANSLYKFAEIDPSFRFDEGPHEYWFNGQVIPGCTGIIKNCGLMGDTRHIPEWTMDRGTDVHLATHFLDEGDLNWDSIEEDWHGYLYSWGEFKHAYKFMPHVIEMPLYHPRLLYGATVDRDGEVDGEPAIVEIKTGELKDWHGYQTAAQEEVLKQWDIAPKKRRRIGVRLSKDGSFSKEKNVREFDDPLDLPVFRAALLIEQRKRK